MNYIASRHNSCAVTLPGDTNYPGINCQDPSECICFIHAAKSNALHQQFLLPTRDDAMLDLFLTINPGSAKACHLLEEVSDRITVFMVTNLSVKKPKTTETKRVLNVKRLTLRYSCNC